ncbi:cyclin B1 interacting protein 1, E3 ubiquitin protein ligase [Dipsacomyces acuminosporus]|nr:cyclin B1 interacting protein 1, E3 ubiquitin protein ligase [Dipsacomyces acuminosporus]
MLTADIMAVSLAVTEEYKSTILAGLPPQTIMDICSRALSFWFYQNAQELAYQKALVQAEQERAKAAELRASVSVNQIAEKLKATKEKVASLQSAMRAERQERALAEDAAEEKNRQLRGLKVVVTRTMPKIHQPPRSKSETF